MSRVVGRAAAAYVRPLQQLAAAGWTVTVQIPELVWRATRGAVTHTEPMSKGALARLAEKAQ